MLQTCKQLVCLVCLVRLSEQHFIPGLSYNIHFNIISAIDRLLLTPPKGNYKSQGVSCDMQYCVLILVYSICLSCQLSACTVCNTDLHLTRCVCCLQLPACLFQPLTAQPATALPCPTHLCFPLASPPPKNNPPLPGFNYRFNTQ